MTRSLSLYELTNADLNLQRQLEEMGADEALTIDTLEGERGALELKLQSYIRVAADFKVAAKAIEDRAAEMLARAEAARKRSDAMHKAVHDAMTTLGIQSIRCPDFELVIQRNAPKADIFDADQIPPELMRIPEPAPPAPVPDNKAILQALKDGIEVPGARLVQTTRLKVK